MALPRSPFDKSPLSGIAGFVVALLVIYVLFKIVGWVVSLLYMFAPILFIASLIIDHRVFLGYIKGIQNLFKRNWIYGVAAGVLSLALYPFVFLYFLGMALFKKKVKEARKEDDVRRNGQWVDYEELPEDEGDIDTTFEELPPPPEPIRRAEPRQQRGDSGYDDYFK